ncbi:MAG: hydroxyacylglutathione hydrolase [Burkholderiaceae bacterium]|nr:MAG: hydroxyacylglutathione hydrolase [Burkholderiaceae bacterium]
MVPVPAFADNYIWLLHNGARAWVVDPGTADGVAAYLAQHRLTLAGILVTHHHADHIGGVDELAALSPKLSIVGPATPRIPQINHSVAEGDSITLPELGLALNVLAVPGHVDEHIAFFAAAHNPPLLFCGDTLFGGGCGRVFEGTPERLYHSLQKLAQLPAATQVFCAHEYTQSNLRFAHAVEPDNPDLQTRINRVTALRSARQPTLPSTIGEEHATNPFLRTHLPALAASAQHHEPGSGTDAANVFRVLRQWKNHF